MANKIYNDRKDPLLLLLKYGRSSLGSYTFLVTARSRKRACRIHSWATGEEPAELLTLSAPLIEALSDPQTCLPRVTDPERPGVGPRVLL